jgi:small-conductance mechanosensitive channel
MLKQLGLISIALMWVGTVLLLRSKKPNKSQSISKHAGLTNRSHRWYALIELLVVSLFFTFLFKWFIPEYHLGLGFGLTACVGLVGTVIAAFIPDRSGWQNKVHTLGSYSMAITLLIMDTLILFNSDISHVARLLAGVAVVYMAIGWAVAIINVNYFRNHMLRAQIIYFTLFHVSILTATYISK